LGELGLLSLGSIHKNRGCVPRLLLHRTHDSKKGRAMTGAGCGLKGSWKRSSGEDANYGELKM
jgi:hypothetical protein